MGSLSENITWQIDNLRLDVGVEVVFNGQVYDVISESVAGAKAGTDKLPSDVLGAYTAGADPRVFSFTATDFAPYTSTAPPSQGSNIFLHGRRYLVTNSAYDDLGNCPSSLLVYGYRADIFSGVSAPPPVTLPDLARIEYRSREPDGFGTFIEAWKDAAANVPCRLTKATGVRKTEQVDALKSIVRWRCEFAVGTDLKPQYRVTIVDHQTGRSAAYQVTGTDDGKSGAALLMAYLVEINGH